MEPRQKQFFKAIKSNNLKLIDEKNFEDLVNLAHHKSFQYPIHFACEFGRIEVLPWLAKKGANFNVTDRDGKHALHYAAHNLHVECCHFLIKGKLTV